MSQPDTNSAQTLPQSRIKQKRPKAFSGLLKMNVEQLKAFIIENDTTFVKHIPASEHQEWFDRIYENALLNHALSLLS